MFNIGEEIKLELIRQERTVSWFARKLNCTRAMVYRIFSKNSIDTRMLEAICRALNHDFFYDISCSMDLADDNTAENSEICSSSGK